MSDMLLTLGEIDRLNEEIEASKEFQDLPDDKVTQYVGLKHCEAQLAKLLKVYKDEELREELLKIERCETDAECPTEYASADPCAECRTNQILPLLLGRIEEAYKRGMEDAQIEKDMEGEE